MAAKGDPRDLDDILDRALDDFVEDQEVSKTDATTVQQAARASAVASASATSTAVPADTAEMLEKLMADMDNPEFRDSLQATLREMSGEPPTPAGPSVANPFAALSGGAELGQTDAAIARTLEMLAAASQGTEGVDPASTEAMGEEVMKKMMADFESMGEKPDFQAVVDQMMRQLLSKDIMYLPLKQICEKYPEWLADNESRLPVEEYENYGKQYQYFQELVAVYETEPDNFPRLMELMQDMQETGQPPADIIQELAPGLEFSDNGMPLLPNMGPGMPPQVAGMPPGCSIM